MTCFELNEFRFLCLWKAKSRVKKVLFLSEQYLTGTKVLFRVA